MNSAEYYTHRMLALAAELGVYAKLQANDGYSIAEGQLGTCDVQTLFVINYKHFIPVDWISTITADPEQGTVTIELSVTDARYYHWLSTVNP